MPDESRGVALHKYLYAHADPVMGFDPSGNMTIVEVGVINSLIGTLAQIAIPTIPASRPLHTTNLLLEEGLSHERILKDKPNVAFLKMATDAAAAINAELEIKRVRVSTFAFGDDKGLREEVLSAAKSELIVTVSHGRAEYFAGIVEDDFIASLPEDRRDNFKPVRCFSAEQTKDIFDALNLVRAS